MALLDALFLDPHPLDVWIACRKDGIKGSGTLNDPYDGSTDAKFDGIMAALPANVPVRVHLGSSTAASPFQTKGFWIESDGITMGSTWQPRANMSIVGAGVDVTYLQLLPGSIPNSHYFAIGAPTTSLVDYFELAGLTIDCNLPAATAACGAVRLMGNHVRIHDLKLINWGSRTTAQPGFGLALIIADPDSGSPVQTADDAVIADCIAVEPSANNDLSNTAFNVLHVGGRERTSTPALTVFGRGPIIRNCFVDATPPELVTLSCQFRALSMGACLGGVVEGNQVHNIEIGGPYQDKLNTQEIIVRNNTYRNVERGPYWKLGVASGIGVRYLLVEGNHIQLPASNPGSTSIAIHVDDNGLTQAPHGQVIIRNNKLRYVDSAVGDFNGYGIQANGASALIVSDNIVELDPANPLRNQRCGAVTYFNNRTPIGVLVEGFNPDTLQRYAELETDNDFALLLSLFNRKAR